MCRPYVKTPALPASTVGHSPPCRITAPSPPRRCRSAPPPRSATRPITESLNLEIERPAMRSRWACASACPRLVDDRTVDKRAQLSANRVGGRRTHLSHKHDGEVL